MYSTRRNKERQGVGGAVNGCVVARKFNDNNNNNNISNSNKTAREIVKAPSRAQHVPGKQTWP